MKDLIGFFDGYSSEKVFFGVSVAQYRRNAQRKYASGRIFVYTPHYDGMQNLMLASFVYDGEVC